MCRQLAREARPFPRLRLASAASLFDCTYDHFALDGYDPHPAIAVPVAV
ncbi:thymidylate synthase [Frankia sp. AgPm24]|nr:thymidylate synthase [Frankia sp. AgPm24]MCK9923669.1 thymidylate synthase [Frankia sp. AgPm24]